uniref:auxin-responsive protein SAUR15-like n=1 Tax=Erigeron canadensis TaxID=72917 RepID=UPI001CB8909E|nr:auxin-responsive protein SAUR15-like [Erigeron canadensis]
MLSKKIGFVKRLANKIKVGGCIGHGSDILCYENLSRSCDLDENKQVYNRSCTSTPRGCIALYVGEEQQRFVVRTSHLSHPLFQILLEKMADEFGFDQKDRLVVPCSVVVFRELMSAVKCNNGKFDSRCLIEEININSN